LFLCFYALFFIRWQGIMLPEAEGKSKAQHGLFVIEIKLCEGRDFFEHKGTVLLWSSSCLFVLKFL
jgi:hypothetical protein